MCSHYLVDPVACTPASGWEKGQVENQVGLVREASRRFAKTAGLPLFLFSALLAGTAGAAAGDKTDVVRDLAGCVGPIVGSASACRDIARPRIQAIVDKFTAAIVEASSNEAERSDLTQAFDRSVADGRGAVTTGRTDCRS
jgi:hypothetical protein